MNTPLSEIAAQMNDEAAKRWLKDHPGANVVPESVKSCTERAVSGLLRRGLAKLREKLRDCQGQ
jgi:hypothetical protein